MKKAPLDERGSAVIMVALAMVVLVGFTALVIDGGNLYFRHTRFQDAADATALAAAIELGQNAGGSHGPNWEAQRKERAFAAAKDYAVRNGLSVSSPSGYLSAINGYRVTVTDNRTGEQGQMKVIFPEGVTKVQVDIEVLAKMTLAGAVGISTAQVPVSAIAQVGQAGSQTGGIIPVSVVDDPSDPNDGNFVQWRQVDMTLGPGGGTNGNYLWLDFGAFEGVNGNTLTYYLEHGYPGTLEVGQTIETHPGVITGVDGPIEARLAPCTVSISTYTEDEFTYYNSSEINQHLAAEPNCPRLVYLPIMDSITEPTTIIGFAAYFIEEYLHEGNLITLRGTFLNRLNPADIIPSNLSYATQSVRLVK